jgi:hypothetical protein
MKTRTTAGLRLLAAALVWAAAAGTAHAQYQVQTIDLQPGWNAVYLEVEPVPNDSASVFASIPAPVLSAWTWSPSANPVQFVQNPGELLQNRTGWLGYFPGDPNTNPEAALTNLFRVEANRAYLIRLDGVDPVTWQLRGRPSVRERRWVPDSFNFAGFAVEDTVPPTFAAYFDGSPAHVDQPIYRLGSDGTWELIPSSSPIERGVAYWIYTNGASSYQGPIAVDVTEGDGLDFGQRLDNLRVHVRNHARAAATIRFRVLASDPPPGGGSVEPAPLTYWTLNAAGDAIWPDFPSSLGLAAPAGDDVSVLVGVRRTDLTGPLGENVLEVTDGRGARTLVPIVVQQVAPTVGPITVPLRGAGRSGAAVAAAAVAAPPFAGLWIGTVNVSRVSESQVFDPAAPAPTCYDAQNFVIPCPEACADANGDPVSCPPQTGSLVATPTDKSFDFRIIVHVDENNRARLLKEVTQMWKDGTRNADGTPATPGRHVLVSDDARLPDFKGSSIRDGRPVGRRVSTSAYDFAGAAVLMTPDAGFGPGNTLSVDLVMPKTFPTNPFTHLYHPDHDNLDPFGNPSTFESYDIVRRISLTFLATDPTGANRPGWGTDEVGGMFRELFDVEYEQVTPQIRALKKGVHKNPIVAEGTFRLRRVSINPRLNE